jgi:hypothetical protein
MNNVIKILPSINDETIKFEILKSFAELCVHYHSLPAGASTTSNIEILYNILLDYLPKPLEDSAVVVVVVDQLQQQEDAKFNFSYVECLMYAFHTLVKYQPAFLNGTEENKERFKEFRLRLQYFAKGTQNYIKELRNSLSNTSITLKENEEVLNEINFKLNLFI